MDTSQESLEKIQQLKTFHSLIHKFLDEGINLDFGNQPVKALRLYEKGIRYLEDAITVDLTRKEQLLADPYLSDFNKILGLAKERVEVVRAAKQQEEAAADAEALDMMRQAEVELDAEQQAAYEELEAQVDQLLEREGGDLMEQSQAEYRLMEAQHTLDEDRKRLDQERTELERQRAELESLRSQLQNQGSMENAQSPGRPAPVRQPTVYSEELKQRLTHNRQGSNVDESIARLEQERRARQQTLQQHNTRAPGYGTLRKTGIDLQELWQSASQPTGTTSNPENPLVTYAQVAAFWRSRASSYLLEASGSITLAAQLQRHTHIVPQVRAIIHASNARVVDTWAALKPRLQAVLETADPRSPPSEETLQDLRRRIVKCNEYLSQHILFFDELLQLHQSFTLNERENQTLSLFHDALQVEIQPLVSEFNTMTAHFANLFG